MQVVLVLVRGAHHVQWYNCGAAKLNKETRCIHTSKPIKDSDLFRKSKNILSRWTDFYRDEMNKL